MVRVEISYGTAAGVLDRVEDLQHAVLLTYGDRIDAITLRPHDGRSMTVSVDGATVFDGDDRSYDQNDVLRRIDGAL